MLTRLALSTCARSPVAKQQTESDFSWSLDFGFRVQVDASVCFSKAHVKERLPDSIVFGPLIELVNHLDYNAISVQPMYSESPLLNGSEF